MDRRPSSHCIRKPWTSEEDNKLIEYIRGAFGDEEPKRWGSVAENLGLENRNGSSCRTRWFQHLKPGIQPGPLTVSEIFWILKRHSELGDNAWSTIENELVGRTDNMIKKFWHTHVVGAVRELKRESNRVTYQQIMRRILMKRNQAAAAAGGSDGYDENEFAHDNYALLAQPFQDNGGVVDAADTLSSPFSTTNAAQVNTVTKFGSTSDINHHCPFGYNIGSPHNTYAASPTPLCFSTFTADHGLNLGAADGSSAVAETLTDIVNHHMKYR